MNAPQVDRVASIAAELGRLGRRLDDLGAELLTVQAGAPQERVAQPDTAPSVAPPVAPSVGPAQQPPLPSRPAAAPDASGPYSGASTSGTSYPTGPYAGASTTGARYPSQPYPAGPHPTGPYPDASYPSGPYPAGPYAGGPYPNAPYPGATYPAPTWEQGRPTYGPAAPASTPTARRPLRQWLTSLSGARLLAWTGAGVTLLGVVLFLALAAARGWFAPPVRVGAGAVLGLALVGVGARLHRRETARTGALAVTGTGIATLYLVVAAATSLYGYLPAAVGLVLALLVAAGGLGLADRWRSALLAGGAVVGAALLAPVVTERPTPLLVALVLVLQAAATVVALRRSWPVLVGIAAAWPVLYGTIVAGLALPAERWATAAVSVAVLVLGVVGAAWVGRGTAGLLPRGLRIGLVLTAPVPALTFAAVLDGLPGAALAYLAAVLLVAVAALPRADHVLRVVALATGALALFEATAIAFDGDVQTAVLLGQGVVLLVVAAVLRSRAVLAVAGAFAGVGALSAMAVQVPLEALVSYPAAPFVLGPTPQRAALLAAVTMSVLLLAATVAALVASARVGLLGADARAARLWGPVGLVGLYGAAGLVIAVALLVSPSRAGFVAGHAVVTVSWTLVALVLLARGIRRPALRVAGLVLVAAAVAKLVLFDLVALDGLARVGAFLGAGLLLLAAGTRYARLVAEADAEGGNGVGDAPSEPAQPRA